MRWNRTSVLALLVLSALVGCKKDAATDAGSDGTSDTTSEVKKLQGEWVLTSMYSNNEWRNMDNPDLAVRIVLEGNKHYSVVNGKRATTRDTTWKVNASKKPGHFDLHHKYSNGREITELCLYELKGDTLTLCTYAREEPERPTAITPGKDIQIQVYQRAKK